MAVFENNHGSQDHQQKLGQNTANILQGILDPESLVFRNGCCRLIARRQLAIQRPLKETHNE